MMLTPRQCAALAMTAGLSVLGGCRHEDPVDAVDHTAEVQQARQQRLVELRQPDGLLSHVASGRLEPGRHSIGSARGNRIRLPQGEAQLGWVELAADQSRLVWRDGRSQPLEIAAPGGPQGTRVPIGNGVFFLVNNGGNFGWRYRLPGAVTAHPFREFAYFPLDPQWRVTARWVDYGGLRPRPVMTSNGGVLDLQSPGEAHFVYQGKSLRLQPVLSLPGDPRLMFLFTDMTSGRESFNGGRYLFVPPPRGQTLVLDFNLAENPACALTPHVVCPVPPEDSRLAVPVRAGEKDWHGGDQPVG